MGDQESAVKEVLGTKQVMLKNPARMALTEFYPSASTVRSQVAEALNKNAVIKISTNSLALGSMSSFSLDSNQIIYGVNLKVTFPLPINGGAPHGFVGEGWLFQAIESIEYTISGSKLNNATVSGIALREYMLACCEGPEERRQLLQTAGRVQLTAASATTATATIPLGWILGARGVGVSGDGDWGIDQSTFTGPIQFNVNWAPSSNFYVGTSTGAAVPANTVLVAAWQSAYVTVSTTQVMHPAFGVSNSLAQSPGSSYTIPVKYLSSVRNDQIITAGVEASINLVNAPFGNLEAIILSIKPQTEVTSTSGAAGGAVYGGGVDLTTLRLQYNGENYYKCESTAEIDQLNRLRFGDTKRYEYEYLGPNLTAATGVVPNAAHVNSRDLVNRAKMECGVTIIPFSYNSKDVMSGRLVENLKSYSNATLSLSFTVGQRRRRSGYFPFVQFDDSTIAGGAGGTLGAGAVQYRIDVLYVCSALLEVSGNTVSLIVG